MLFRSGSLARCLCPRLSRRRLGPDWTPSRLDWLIKGEFSLVPRQKGGGFSACVCDLPADTLNENHRQLSGTNQGSCSKEAALLGRQLSARKRRRQRELMKGSKICRTRVNLEKTLMMMVEERKFVVKLTSKPQLASFPSELW